MSETLEEFIRRALHEALLAKWKQHGWWCPRCEIPAPPWRLVPNEGDGSDSPGWCPFCGMDPLTEGPAPRREGTLSSVIGATKKTARR